MHTIKDELKKIYHFLLMLVLLFAVNLGFNMLYDWGGVSVIVRIYIMVLSCYIIFNFSQLDAEELRESYISAYGRKGNIYLFFVLRIFPFLFIYLMTIIFTLINYIQNSNWPLDTLLRLMDGRYSNTVIYALILFIVLKMKIRPGIGIPVFITVAILYFYTDKLFYRLFEPGMGVAVIKVVKLSIFYIILIYGFSRNRMKAIHSAAAGSFMGVITFLMVGIVFYQAFYFSNPAGTLYSMSARILLKSGFYPVLDEFEKVVAVNDRVADIADLILFSEKAGRDIEFTPGQWESFIVKSEMENADYIFRYLNKKNIKLNFDTITDYAMEQSQKNPEDFIRSSNLKRYYASYYKEKSDSFFSLYNSGNTTMKKWIIDIFAYTVDYDTTRFLIDKLTDVDKKISERAYISLKEITKLDPADSGKKEFHDLEVVDAFREYSAKLRGM